jgi:hypothetical protein
MKRILLGAALSMLGLSCQAPGERAALPPMLPEKVTPLPYAQLLTRARALASRATDASYTDSWIELEEIARGLEQTAQYLTKADDVPAKHKDTLATVSADLGKLSKELLDAATAKDVKKTTEVLQRLNKQVREMKLAD